MFRILEDGDHALTRDEWEDQAKEQHDIGEKRAREARMRLERGGRTRRITSKGEKDRFEPFDLAAPRWQG